MQRLAPTGKRAFQHGGIQSEERDRSETTECAECTVGRSAGLGRRVRVRIAY